MSNICDECETVAHCIKHGCIPKQQALDRMAENAREQPAQKCSYPYCGCNSKAWCKVERNEALDKKAENARELGLDYEPAQQEPVAKVCHDLDGHIGWNPNLRQLPAEGTALYTSPPPQRPHECSRSHPHENMDAMCELRTEIARLTNENARLKAQPAQQEPVAWWIPKAKQFCLPSSDGTRPFAKAWEPLYTSPQPAQQEPVAWYDSKTGWTDFHPFKPARKPSAPDAEWLPLYTSPPAQRTWVGLTDEEIYSVLENLQVMHHRPPTTDSRVIFALAIEAKLKEKNT